MPSSHDNVLADARRYRAEVLAGSSSAFGRPFALFFAGLATTLFALRTQGIVGPFFTVMGMLSLPLLAAGCALPFAWLTQRRRDERQARELADARRQQQESHLRLLVLQAQIEPHFLFNTLASLRALLREDIDQAEHMVDSLVEHLRAVLPLSRNETGVSTLADQLAICVSYLDLMAVRLEGRLTYRIDVPDSLLDAVFPPLMLLTLVENAIKHGIEPKVGAGCIGIDAQPMFAPSGSRLLVTVTDDGAGLTPGPQTGLGLKNVREQLAVRYGESAAVSLSEAANGGTVASLLIPYERYSP